MRRSLRKKLPVLYCEISDEEKEKIRQAGFKFNMNYTDIVKEAVFKYWLPLKGVEKK